VTSFAAPGAVNKFFGEKNGKSKLTGDKVIEIRRRYDAGEQDQYELANDYHVSQAAIGNITRRDTWRHI